MNQSLTAGVSLLFLLATLTGCGNSADPLIPDRNLPGFSPESSLETETESHAETKTDTTPEIRPATPTETTPSENPAAESPALPDPAKMISDRDRSTDYDPAACITIQLTGDSATASDRSVQIQGSAVTVTKEGTYLVTGTLTNGSLTVRANAGDKIQILLDDVQIHSDDTAPLHVATADKVFLTLAEGSDNTLSNGGSFTGSEDEGMDAALFSRQDLTINGTGSLTITSPAGHGITSKDDLVLTGGTITVTAASHGLDANDSIRLTDTTLTVTAGKDGIHAENADDPALGFVYLGGGTFSLTAQGDGISASSTLLAEDGTVTILAGGGYKNGTKASSDNWGGFPGGGGFGGFTGGDRNPGGRDPGGKDRENPGQQPGGMPDSFGGWNGGNSGSIPDSTAEGESASTSMKGMKSVGEMRIMGGDYTINSADDGLHSDSILTVLEGTVTISTGDDGLHAEETLTVSDGNITITDSYEGLEAHHVTVSGGTVTLTASDDGLNAAGGNDASGTTGGRDAMFGGWGGGKGEFGGFGGSSDGSITVSGGTLSITSSGDGMDANGTLRISGGSITIEGPTQGDTATLDYDKSAVITGGTFIGTGASGMMAQTFSDSEQGVIAVSVGNQKAGTPITLADGDGNVILTHEPSLSFAVVILSSPDLTKGEIYTVTIGSSSGEIEAK